jgi:hypothetical protein
MPISNGCHLGHLNTPGPFERMVHLDLIARVALTVLCLPHSNAENDWKEQTGRAFKPSG